MKPLEIAIGICVYLALAIGLILAPVATIALVIFPVIGIFFFLPFLTKRYWWIAALVLIAALFGGLSPHI